MERSKPYMKKILKAVVLTAVIAALLTVSAFASDYDHCADALHDLGLFSGTDAGYELDRAPNRAETAVMLVRMLGQEQNARQLTYSAPFTDVPQWAQPYVQYLYDNGLASGASANIFGSGELCTAQQYTAFLLRALGYSDKAGGDFTYMNALEFGQRIGLVDAFNCNTDNFLRDNVVAMSYTALATAPKSGEADLLTKLVNTGAVKDAKGYDKLFQTFRDYGKALSESNSSTTIAMIADVKANIQSSGINMMDMNMKMDLSMKIDQNNIDKSKMAIIMDMEGRYSDELVNAGFVDPSQASEKTRMAVYFTDGYAYVNSDGQKVKTAASAKDFYDEYMTAAAAAEEKNYPICVYRELTATTSGNTTTYHAVLADGPYNSLFVQLLDMAEQQEGAPSDASMTCDDIILDATVRNGAAVRSKLAMVMHVTEDGETMDVAMDMDIHDFKFGSAVNVALPGDLNTYLDVTGLYEE